MINQRSLSDKRVAITTTISMQDFQFCKERNLKFTRLLENAVSVLRTAETEGVQGNYFNHLKNNVNSLRKRLEVATLFIEENGLHGEYLKAITEKDG